MSRRSGIPAPNCSFPFTYQGELYYQCVTNQTNLTDVGCYVSNRIWKTCTVPTRSRLRRIIGKLLSYYVVINLPISSTILKTFLNECKSYVILFTILQLSIYFIRLLLSDRVADYPRRLSLSSLTSLSNWSGCRRHHQMRRHWLKSIWRNWQTDSPSVIQPVILDLILCKSHQTMWRRR